MKKREMVEEIMEGLSYKSEWAIENRCKSPKQRIEEVYNYYLNSNKTQEDKHFCASLLINLKGGK